MSCICAVYLFDDDARAPPLDGPRKPQCFGTAKAGGPMSTILRPVTGTRTVCFLASTAEVSPASSIRSEGDCTKAFGTHPRSHPAHSSNCRCERLPADQDRAGSRPARYREHRGPLVDHAPKHQRCVRSAEPERVRQHRVDLHRLGLVRDEIDLCFHGGIVEIDRWRRDVVANGKN